MVDSSRFSFGDVVLVPFSFADQSGTKKRPPSSSQATATTRAGATS